MVSPPCIVVLCFALATLTFGAPNVDFVSFDVVASKTGLENKAVPAASQPVVDSGDHSQVPQVPQGQVNTGQGTLAQSNQGQGNTDKGQGNTDQGQGNQGAGNQGQGNQGAGNQGQGNQGAGNQGQGSQGGGNQGQGNQGAGNQGQGNQGAGNQGQGSQGGGNQGPGNQGTGNQGQGNQGQGNQGQGNQGQGNQGAGNQGQGNQGQGNQGQGNQGAGNQGQGNQGQGNQGQGNQGENPPPPPQPKSVIYTFGTKTLYDVQITPDIPFVAQSSPQPMDYSATAKYTDTQNRKITYVEIVAHQTGVGSARIAEGAIGTSSVKIDIVAKASLSYKHEAKFYSSPVQSLIKSLGNSTSKDVILARVKGSEQYSVDSNVAKPITYPGTTDKLKDKKPTYVVVTSTQTSDKLKAEITKGDLKKSKDPLVVTLTAEGTKIFDYEVVFYSAATRSQPLFFTAAVSLLVFLWSRMA